VLPRAFGENYIDFEFFILHIFGTFEKGYFEDSFAIVCSEDSVKIDVPAKTECVIPAAVDGEAGYDFKMGVCVASGGTEAGGRDIADYIGIIGISSTVSEWDGQTGDGMGRGRRITVSSILQSRELFFQPVIRNEGTVTHLAA